MRQMPGYAAPQRPSARRISRVRAHKKQLKAAARADGKK
jgi:hypothetical protein